jgi:hydroxymethylpyrimidine pyrophosphatase-like HAD family hydrolase
LATGRAYFEIIELFRETGLPEALAVCSNGAVVASLPRGEILEVVTFDPRPVLANLLDQVPDALFAVEIVGSGYLVTERFPEGELLGQQTISDLHTLISDPVVRVIVRDPNKSPEDFHDLTRRYHIHGASYSVGYQAWLDLGPLGVSKASGLDKVAALLGLDRRDALAIGDGHNDVEMVQWAGRGVAMGHAPIELKDIADATTLTIFEDGAAVEIEKWF